MPFKKKIENICVDDKGTKYSGHIELERDYDGIINNEVSSGNNPKNLLYTSGFGIFILVLTTILWGSSFIITKTMTEQIPRLFYMGVRFLIAALAFLPLISRIKGFGKIEVLMAFNAGLIYFISNVTQTIGLAYTTASKSGFITGINVLLVPVFLGIFYHKKIDKKIWLAVILSTIGIAILSFSNNAPNSTNSNSTSNSNSILTSGLLSLFNQINIGDLLTIITAITYALYIIYIEETKSKIDVFMYSMLQMFFVSLFSFLGSFILEFKQLFDPNYNYQWLNYLNHNALPIIGIFLYMGAIVTSLTLVFQIHGQKYVSASKTAIIFALEPVFATFFAVLIGGELITIEVLLGALLILGSIFLAIKSET
ncbi:MAG: DMT family transporter [Promethearchaeota archaeon]